MEDPETTRQHVNDLLRRHHAVDGVDGVVGALESLCRAMSDELDLAGAAVTLLPSVDTHAVAACSSTTARQAEEAQFGVGEGPTRDAFTARRPVLIPELESLGARRWPGWTSAALAAGVCAVYAFPLLVGASVFGVLTAYVGPGLRLEARRLEARRLETALVFAEAATELLVDGSVPTNDRQVEPGLAATLGTNGYIYQAQGKVMVELGVSLPEALARMRAHAWATGQELTALAQEILAGRTMPSRDPR